WIYAKGVENFTGMTNLPQDLRSELSTKFSIRLPEIIHAQHSADGTTKYALRMGNETIETVHMPEEKRDTVCISSQAGCSFGCKFCVTARMNLRRHLTAGEIVGQVLLVLKQHGRSRRLNIVFMGMGEPLHNYDQVMKAFRIMTHPDGLAISSRRITVSTVGFLPALQRLNQEKVIPNLAVSLNAPNNDLRDELMPINKMYPIEMLMKELSELPLRHRQRITFEYVLLKGINDSRQHAEQLLKVPIPIRSKINLIPFNPDSHLPYQRPDEETISAFAGILASGGRTVAVRRSRGRDISAACGQLGTQLIDPSRVPLALTRI
ncbi:MAG TPA: 23S rRNA (adenine(2503)-C(2))-methyltransferase RlmN, partial [Acidobacteriota bacterium]|nr:23S rRNA (adenine(2503)-C(2))-methyltransferase RlmN [Acidobacteriota bacterium]